MSEMKRYVRFLFLQFVIVQSVSVFSGGRSQASVIEPTLDMNKKTVLWGKDVDKAIRDWRKDFSLYQFKDYMLPVRELFEDASSELPMGILGDFNGDGIRDLAVMGFTRRHEVIAVALSDKEKTQYQIIEILELPYNPAQKLQVHTVDGQKFPGLDTYLSFLSRSSFKRPSSEDGKATHLSSAVLPEGDGLQIEIFRSAASRSYAWDGKKFIPYQGDLR